MTDMIRRLFRGLTGQRAVGGSITPPDRNDDSIPAWLSDGYVSHDGGETWTRTPTDLNPWAGAAVVALHNHTETDMCDDTCSVYDSRGSEDTE